MKLYAGIDLHSNNSVVVVLDETDRVLYQKRVANNINVIRAALGCCVGEWQGVAVESTYNWYWLVDGLKRAGYPVHLVNTAAVKQYEGLKHSDDVHDARHIAHLLRLGILPTGYICPPELRAVRDLARKRAQLVRQRTTQILSIGNLYASNLGANINGTAIKRLTATAIEALGLCPEQQLALKANVAVLQCLSQEIAVLEQALLAQMKLREDYGLLRTVPGIGEVLAYTIALETGEIARFASAGYFASYARTVNSRRESNGKKKGEGNRKCGNKYLAWAFVEAAHFAVRYDPMIRGFYQKKCRQRLPVVAIKAVAHKLARACYHVLHEQQPFDVHRAFS